MLPALSLGAELVGRGHQVRALGDPTIEPSARAAGCAFSPWREAPHFNSVAEQTAMIDAGWWAEPRIRHFVLPRIYAGKAMTSRFARDVISTVRESPVDAILGRRAARNIDRSPRDQASHRGARCADICAAHARAAAARHGLVTRSGVFRQSQRQNWPESGITALDPHPSPAECRRRTLRTSAAGQCCSSYTTGAAAYS